MALRDHPSVTHPNPRSVLQPGVTSILKDFMVDTLPKDYPFSVDKSLKRAGHQPQALYHIPFFEFRGQGPPPNDIGHVGDVYVDTTPASHALYAKTQIEWKQWAGPSVDWGGGVSLFSHPYFNRHSTQSVERHLWCNGRRVAWYSTGSIQNHWRQLKRTGVLVPGSGVDTKVIGRVVAGNLIGEMLREERQPEPKKREQPSEDIKPVLETKKQKIGTNNDIQIHQYHPSTSQAPARKKSSQTATFKVTPVIRPPRITGTTPRVQMLQLLKAEQQETSLSSLSQNTTANDQKANRAAEEEKKLLQNELSSLKKKVGVLTAENAQVVRKNVKLDSENRKLKSDARANAVKAGPGTGRQETEFEAFPPEFLKFMTDAYAKRIGCSNDRSKADTHRPVNRRQIPPERCLASALTPDANLDIAVSSLKTEPVDVEMT